MPSKYSIFHRDPLRPAALGTINFNIEKASSLIQQACVEAIKIAQKIVLVHPHHLIARRLLESGLEVAQAFMTQNNLSDASKKQIYLSFAQTVTDASEQLNDKTALRSLMDTLCRSIGKIMYNRTDQLPQIRSNLDKLVKLMDSAWQDNQPVRLNQENPHKLG